MVRKSSILIVLGFANLATAAVTFQDNMGMAAANTGVALLVFSISWRMILNGN